MRKLPAALVCALAVALPRAALACPVCIGSNDQNAVAFAATTTFLSALPLAMVGVLVGYLRRRARQADQPAESAPPKP